MAVSVNASNVTKLVCRQQHTQSPQVGQRCITDTEVYINRTCHQHHCMLLCMQDLSCQVINFNIFGSYCLLSQRPCISLEQNADFVTRYMAKKPPCLKWVKNYGYDAYEIISFPKADDPSDSQMIIRVRMGQSLIPGKMDSKTNEIYCSWDGKEVLVPASQAEFLIVSTECNISWVTHDSTSANPLPVRAVIGGHLNDNTLYVARKIAEHFPGHSAEYSAGYYDNVNKRGHFPYSLIDIVYDQFEVLVVQEWSALGGTEQWWLDPLLVQNLKWKNLVVSCPTYVGSYIYLTHTPLCTLDWYSEATWQTLWRETEIETRAPMQYKDDILPVKEIPLWR